MISTSRSTVMRQPIWKQCRRVWTKINAAIKPYIKNGVFDLTAFAKANLNLADVQKLTAQDSNEIRASLTPMVPS